MAQQFYSAREAADRLGISVASVRRLCVANVFGTKLKSHWVIAAAELSQYASGVAQRKGAVVSPKRVFTARVAMPPTPHRNACPSDAEIAEAWKEYQEKIRPQYINNPAAGAYAYEGSRYFALKAARQDYYDSLKRK